MSTASSYTYKKLSPTNTLDSYFDFIVAYQNSPIAPDLGRNILNLALKVTDILKSQADSIIDARRVFSNSDLWKLAY